MVCCTVEASEDLESAMRVSQSNQTSPTDRAVSLRRTRSASSADRGRHSRRHRTYINAGNRQHSTNTEPDLSTDRSENVLPGGSQPNGTPDVDYILNVVYQQIPVNTLVGGAEAGTGNQPQTPEGQSENSLSPHSEAYHHQVAQASGVILRILGDEFNALYEGTSRTTRSRTNNHHR